MFYFKKNGSCEHEPLQNIFKKNEKLILQEKNKNLYATVENKSTVFPAIII